MQLEECWCALHLVGLSLAIGGVIVTDISVLRRLIKPSAHMSDFLPTMHILHRSILSGLGLLIVSGTFIVFTRFDSLAAVPDKVWFKIFLVCMLSMNAAYISTRLLPVFTSASQNKNLTPLILQFARPYRLNFAFSSSISTVGWGGGFLLGAFSPFKTMTYADISMLGLPLWLVSFLITFMALEYLTSSAQKITKTTPHSHPGDHSVADLTLAPALSHKKSRSAVRHSQTEAA